MPSKTWDFSPIDSNEEVAPLETQEPAAEKKWDFSPIEPDHKPFVNEAMGVNPDEHAKNLSLSRKSGLPVGVVESQRPAIEAEVKIKDIDEKLNKSPIIKQWFTEEDNARLAHDDVEGLTAFEAVANAWHRGKTSIKQAGHQWMAEESLEMFNDRSKSFGEIMDDESMSPGIVINPVDAFLAAERYATSRAFGGRADLSAKRSLEMVAQRGVEMQAAGKSDPAINSMEAIKKGSEEDGWRGGIMAVIKDPVGAAALAAEVGIEFLPQMMAAAATTAVTGPSGGAAVMGALSGLTERYVSPVEYFNSQGIDLNKPADLDKVLNDPEIMGKAKIYGLTRASIIGSVDAMSGGLASKAFGGPLRTMATQMGVQGAMAGFGESMAMQITTGEIDPAEVILEVLGEFAMAPFEVIGVGGQYVGDFNKSQEAKKNAKFLKDLLAQETLMRDRDPEKFAELEGKILRDKGVNNISISGEGFSEFNQSGGDTSWIKDLGLSESGKLEMYEAMGGDIELTPEQYAMIPPEVAGALSKHMRINDGITEAESEVFDTEGMQDEFDRISDKFQSLDSEKQEDAQMIQQRVEEQLQSAGESSDTSAYGGILTAQRYITRAQRTGQNALELYMKDNLNIVQNEQMQKSVDETTINIDRARSTKSKEDYLNLEKRPVVDRVIKTHGGVDPDSDFAAELRAKGVTKAMAPGLFKKGGAGSADNFVHKEFPFFNERSEELDLNSFVDPDALIDAIAREAFGEPNYTEDQKTELKDFSESVDNFNMELESLGMDINENTDEEIRAAIEGKTFEQMFTDTKVDFTSDDPIFSIPRKELKDIDITVKDKESGAEHTVEAKKAVNGIRVKFNQVKAIVDCVNAV